MSEKFDYVSKSNRPTLELISRYDFDEKNSEWCPTGEFDVYSSGTYGGNLTRKDAVKLYKVLGATLNLVATEDGTK